MSWFTKIRTDISSIIPLNIMNNNLTVLSDVDLKVMLKNTVETCPVVEHRFNQLQEIEAILEYPNIEQRRKRQDTIKNI